MDQFYAGDILGNLLVQVLVVVQKEDFREEILVACRFLEMMAMQVFTNNG